MIRIIAHRRNIGKKAPASARYKRASCMTAAAAAKTWCHHWITSRLAAAAMAGRRVNR